MYHEQDNYKVNYQDNYHYHGSLLLLEGDVSAGLLLVHAGLDALLNLAGRKEREQPLLFDFFLLLHLELEQPPQTQHLHLRLLELPVVDSHVIVGVHLVHHQHRAPDHLPELLVLHQILLLLVAELVQRPPRFRSAFLQQFRVPANHLLNGSITPALPLGVHLLVQLIPDLPIRLRPDLLNPFVVDQLLDELVLVSLIVQLGPLLSPHVLFPHKGSQILQHNVQHKLGQPRLLEVVVLENREHDVLDHVHPVDLEVQLVEIPLLTQHPLLLLDLAEIELFVEAVVPFARALLDEGQQLCTAPPHLRIHLQATVKDVDPHQRELYLFFVLVAIGILQAGTDQPVLQVHQPPPDVGLPVVCIEPSARGAQQLLAPAEDLVESATKGVDVDLGVVDFRVADLGSLVVAGAAVAVGLGQVGIAHLGNSEVNQVHTGDVLAIQEDQIGRFEIPMDNSHTLLLFLPLLPRPVAPHQLHVQVMQNVRTPQHELDHIILLHRTLDPLAETAPARILCHEVELPVLQLEDVDHVQHILTVPLLYEGLQHHQLPVPVLLALPLLRFLELLQHHLLVVHVLLPLPSRSANSHMHDAEPAASQKLASFDLIVPSGALDSGFHVLHPPLRQFIILSHFILITAKLTQKTQSSIPTHPTPHIQFLQLQHSPLRENPKTNKKTLSRSSMFPSRVKLQSSLPFHFIAAPQEQPFSVPSAKRQNVQLLKEGGISKLLSISQIYLDFLKANMGNQLCGTESLTPINPHILKGNELYKTNKFQEAVDEYTLAIGEEPNNVDAYSNRALANKSLDNIPAAIDDLNKIIEINPSDADAYNHRGMAHHQLGKDEEAIADFDTAIKISPQHSQAYIHRGDIKKDREQYGEAVLDYTEGIKHDKRYVSAYEDRGICYLRLKQHQEAVADFNRVLEESPNSVEGYVRRGYAYNELNHFELAVNDYTKALQSNPAHYEALAYRGKTQMEMKHYPQAESDIKEALSMRQDHPIFLFYLAECDLQQQRNYQNNLQQGLRSFQREDNTSLKQKYDLTEENIRYIDFQVSKYNDHMMQLQHIQNESTMTRHQQISDEATTLMHERKALFIPRLANYQGRHTNDDETLRLFEEKTTILQKKNDECISKELKNIIQEINQIDKGVFDDQKIYAILSTIQEPEKREYFETLYNFMINHLLTYRVCYTAYFAANTEPFTETENVAPEISFEQPITKHTDVFPQLVKVPFHIIENTLHEKVHIFSRTISHKVGTSNLKSDQVIAEFVLFAIEELAKDKEFNGALQRILNEDKDTYLNTTWTAILQGQSQQGQQYNEAEMFGTDCTHTQKVVITHMILIGKQLYDIDLQAFHTMAETKQAYYDQVRRTLPPMSKKQEQSLIQHGDLQDMGGKKEAYGCGDNCLIM